MGVETPARLDDCRDMVKLRLYHRERLGVMADAVRRPAMTDVVAVLGLDRHGKTIPISADPPEDFVTLLDALG